MEFKLAIACDHGGYELKKEILAYLDAQGIAYCDFGCDSTASVNYPEYAAKVCRAIEDGSCTRGILVCGTGIGMSIAANKHRGIRAACCSDTFSARMTRMHNDANVLCLGGRVVGVGLALDMVKLFVETEFEGGRHVERVAMLTALES
ncbi:MAG: ribose 5-phosphate isomerase B [Clostridia bacterium]|nr:ribose 5-phosphate isomerase B [Clostridia bacterium]